VQFKQQIKQQILNTLGSPESLVRTQVAQIVTAIASIEIPRKEWDELIPSLCMNAQSDSVDIGIKHASMTAIGFICEDLQPKDINEDIKNKII
jgi:importin subunit beta-1